MYAAEGISVRIDGRTIIAGIDLALPPGRIVVVIGPNGAGKSTLLRTMAGERKPTSGTVRVHGRDVPALTPAALAGWRAVLGQAQALTVAFTVDEIVRLGIPPTMRTAAADALVARGLAAVGLADMAARPLPHLSGGEQQRAHAARVLVQLWAQPDDGAARYLFLDEPTTHLDPAHQLLILGLARAHAAAGGGVLAVLHDLNLAAAFADEIVVLAGGAVVARGMASAILSAPLLREVYGVDFDVIRNGERSWIMPRMSGPPSR